MWNFRENLRDCASRYFGYHVPQRVAAMQRALLRRVLPRLSRSVCTKPDPPKSPPPPSALTIAASGLTSFAGIGAISALHFGIAPHDLTMVLGSMGASAVLLYDLGRATHRDDDYRIILSAVWQTVLRSNQRPRVVLKTLMVLEAVLINGPDRALEETIDMKTDIKALQVHIAGLIAA